MDGIHRRPDAGGDSAHAVPCARVRALRAGPQAALKCACVRGNRDRQPERARTADGTGARVGLQDRNVWGARR